MIDMVRDKPAMERTDRGRPPRSTVRRRRASRQAPPTVAVVVYDGLTLFEFSLAYEVFGTDRSALLGVPWYRTFVCGVVPGTVTVDGGLQMSVPYGLEPVADADSVIVPPTELVEEVPGEVLEVLRETHRRGRRIISLCTGAFVLARAGLLEGRRVTTHWAECDAMAQRYPGVSVDARVLYVDDDDILTSAGSAAGIDLCLHVVRNDFGTEVATQLARHLVVPPQRDGGQAQYIDTPMPVLESSNLFADTVAWLQEHLDEPVTVDELAARSAMSPRTFARRFLASTGTTPYQWLVRQRVQLAQRLLETSDMPIEMVANRSGFCTAGNLRKHFGRLMDTSPQAYRRTFSRSGVG
jgi:AraC family transcriptional activator FtrA